MEKAAAQRPLVKVKARTASEVCARFALEKEAQPLLKDGATPREFLDALVAAGHYRPAISFVAHALPTREAIWWGCLCLRHVSGPRLPAADAAASKAAAEWVLDPTEDRRAAAKGPAEAAGIGRPAGCLAMAVTWTGGSLAPPNPKAQPVPPGPWLPAKGVAAAVQLASVRAQPGRIPDTQRLFVELGAGVAEGRHVWPDVKPKPSGRTWGS